MLHYPPVYTSLEASAVVAAVLSLFKSATIAENQAYGELKAMLPNREFMLTNSGTSALSMALTTIAAKQKLATKKRVVALPAYCCPDVGTAALGAGYRIMLYDTNPTTLMPDWDSVRRCMKEGASVLTVVHLYGRIVDVDMAMNIAGEFGIDVIEDAAQGASGSLGGVPAGALAPYSVLSFGRGKGLNAGGGGAFTYLHSSGALIPEALVAALAAPGLVKQLTTLGKAVVGSLLSSPFVYWLPSLLPFLNLGETVYHEPSAPAASGSVLNCLIASAVKNSKRHLEQRRQIENWYESKLQSCSGILVKSDVNPSKSMQSGALRFPVRLPHEVGNSVAKLGVAKAYPRTLMAYSKIAAVIEGSGGSLSGANTLADTLYTLPTHNLLTISARNQIVDTLLSHCAVR